MNILAILGLIYLTQHFSAQYVLFMFLGWVAIGGYGIAVGYHRLFSHRSFKTWPLVEKLLVYIGIFAGQGSSLFWVAVHRGSHHPFSDTEKDLHSPVNGKFNAYIGWQMFLDPRKVTFKKCTDLLRDPWHLFLHKNYVKVFWGTIAVVALVSWPFALFFFVIPSFISMHNENCVDLFCHLKGLGYRNFATSDNSTNIWWLGYFGFGQGWHNNHHYDPSLPVYSFKWWEVDPCAFLIKLIEKKST